MNYELMISRIVNYRKIRRLHFFYCYDLLILLWIIYAVMIIDKKYY